MMYEAITNIENKKLFLRPMLPALPSCGSYSYVPCCSEALSSIEPNAYPAKAPKGPIAMKPTMPPIHFPNPMFFFLSNSNNLISQPRKFPSNKDAINRVSTGSHKRMENYTTFIILLNLSPL